MIKKITLLLILTSLFSIKNTKSQDLDLVYKNLDYINKQFSLYNDYNTYWAIDTKSKEFYCFDKFGSYHGKISEIIIEKKTIDSDILNFKCISGDCLRESNATTPNKNNYSMGLSKNLASVIEKFDEIRIEYGNYTKSNNHINVNRNSSRKYSNNTKENVKNILNRLTEIFNTENKYKNKWFANWEENYIYGKTKNCEVHIPLGKQVTIEKTEKGYKFLSEEKLIREKCTSFNNLVKVTFEYINSENAKEEVVYLFNEILFLTK
ncbi:hypothetical protein [Polaribacter sp. Z022]|uniref:hypothetical protein n=1 Tax=Polaribacter sp. Z022 TaxID=2927125 RepID=UPI002020B3B1|nr:hypothetical protein [Polaribacter sp. Z022]MCL7753589.1 hypothetical protein [Polaribacter sp. Z022]